MAKKTVALTAGILITRERSFPSVFRHLQQPLVKGRFHPPIISAQIDSKRGFRQSSARASSVRASEKV